MHQGYTMTFALKFIPLTNGTDWTNVPEVYNIPFIPQHPGIVKYFGAIPFEDWAVIGMEACEGTLTDLTNRFMWSSENDGGFMRWDMLRQVAEALHQCHSRQFMHRDVKPSNSKTS